MNLYYYIAPLYLLIGIINLSYTSWSNPELVHHREKALLAMSFFLWPLFMIFYICIAAYFLLLALAPIVWWILDKVADMGSKNVEDYGEKLEPKDSLDGDDIYVTDEDIVQCQSYCDCLGRKK